jgi:hypothetical protein
VAIQAIQGQNTLAGVSTYTTSTPEASVASATAVMTKVGREAIAR